MYKILTELFFKEKMLNAKLANAIPIYWGPPDMEDHVDPKGFVHCNFERPSGLMPAWCAEGGKELKGEALAKCTKRNEDRITHLREQMAVDPKVTKCIERIKELDQNDDKFKQAMTQSILHGNKLTGIWNMSLYGEKVRMLMDAADPPV